MTRARNIVLGLLALGLCAAAPAASQRDDQIVIEGTLGSLPTGVVRTTLQARHADMTACFTSRYTVMPMLGGRIAYVLRVATDGSVRAVRLVESSVGDRETERCLARIGRGLRFPRPTGGEAEVRETFELPSRPGMRPPTDWPESRVRSAVGRNIEGLRRRCNLGQAQVALTVIIGPGGRAATAGVASPGELGDAALDCVAQAAMGFGYPNPGSYYAKTTLAL